MMLQSGDKLLWMNWLPIRQMGYGLLLIDLRIDQSLDQSGCLPRNIMLMAPLSTTRVAWLHRTSLCILDSSILRYLLQQCTFWLYTSYLCSQLSTTSIFGLLMSQMCISMVRWTVMSIWSSQRALNREITRKQSVYSRKYSMAPDKMKSGGITRCTPLWNPWASNRHILMLLSIFSLEVLSRSSCLSLWMIWPLHQSLLMQSSRPLPISPNTSNCTIWGLPQRSWALKSIAIAKSALWWFPSASTASTCYSTSIWPIVSLSWPPWSLAFAYCTIRAPGQQKSIILWVLSTIGVQLALCSIFLAPLNQTLHLQLVSLLHSLQILV